MGCLVDVQSLVGQRGRTDGGRAARIQHVQGKGDCLAQGRRSSGAHDLNCVGVGISNGCGMDAELLRIRAEGIGHKRGKRS